MKNINLKNYDVEIPSNGAIGIDKILALKTVEDLNSMKEVIKKELVSQKKVVPYDVRDSITNILFLKELKLSAVENLKNSELSKKIGACKKDFILLEEAEYKIIKRGVDVGRGFNRNDTEFLKRILEAEDVSSDNLKISK